MVVSHWGHAVGYDCDHPSASYSYQIHFIHIKCDFHTLYVVGGHKDATPHHTIALQVAASVEEVVSNFSSNLKCRYFVMIGSSHPLHTHTRSTICIYNALDILCMSEQSYECVLTPPPLPSQKSWPSLVFGSPL